ncbi:recombination regulator RecX [Eubacteriales bacterium OttesenSCG-928-M02]|nr:recombination regulator RecX [Eubacteriales bacterium OttesenSCG-928-M02]
MEKTPKEKPSAMDRALHYIGYRMRTEKELSDYLAKKEYDSGEIDEVLTRLKEYGYVDDMAFCREYILQRIAQRPVGKRKLEYDLIKKGIPKETIQACMLEYDPKEEQNQCNALAQRLLARKGTDKKAIQSVQRTLVGRGFSYDICKNAIAIAVREREDVCEDEYYDY